MARLVKRYTNRKLYDTSESRYVTLDEIARWVKAGDDVKILENESGEDLTAVTFAQIILEEERKKSGLLSLPVLRQLIQHGEEALKNLAGTVDRGMEVLRTAPERARSRVQALANVSERLGSVQSVLEDLGRRFERVSQLPAFQQEVRRIERTVQTLEARIARLWSRNGAAADAADADAVPPPPPPPDEVGPNGG